MLSIAACSPVFVINGAYQQAKILYRRQPIEGLLSNQKLAQDNSLTEKDLDKLQIVPRVTEFCRLIGLDPKNTYKTYSKLDRDELAWIVSASARDSFTIYNWWFPIVGRVPYKGYFDKNQAIEATNELQEEGYETWLRPTAAFSTLGWFDDPLISTTLSLDTVDLVNTIIHETFHANYWIPGSVAFNESLANFVGSRASIDFFKTHSEKGDPFLKHSEAAFVAELEFAKANEELWQALNTLYASDLSSEKKLEDRQRIFADHKTRFNQLYPGRKFYETLNNAELSQRRLYLRSLHDFSDLFNRLGQDWRQFFKYVKNFADKADPEDENRNFEIFFQADN